MWRPVLTVILLLALLGCSGDSSEKYLKDGLTAFQQQDYDKAIANYEKAIAEGVKSPKAYNMLGLAYRYKYEQVNNPELRANEIIAFQKALEIDPKNWEAMINLGDTYYAEGERAQAAIWFKKALALHPRHPERSQIEKLIAEGATKTPEAGKPTRRRSPRSRPGSEPDAE